MTTRHDTRRSFLLTKKEHARGGKIGDARPDKEKRTHAIGQKNSARGEIDEIHKTRKDKGQCHDKIHSYLQSKRYDYITTQFVLRERIVFCVYSQAFS